MTDPAGVTRAAAGMGIATAVSRAIGFVRILVIAAVLGTTYLGNTYQSSNAVSNVVFELLAAGALSAVLVPTFVEYLDRNDVAGAEQLAGRILGIALVVLGVIVVIGIVAAPLIADLLTTGVNDPVVAERQRDLSTFLLRFFVPQILLYAVGAVAVAVLYAQRRLAVTALAPIGLTIVVVAAMVAFRISAGPSPGLELGTGERLILACGGTLGVVAFVGVPTIALWTRGFRLVPRLGPRDPAVGRALRLSGWAVLQHTLIGVLLLGAIVIGNTVQGGTLAYQVAWVFFLAPYAVLAQPVHTAILPELARQRSQLDRFAHSLRWALEGMAVLVAPVIAIVLALALPLMRIVAFGEATRAGGVGLLAAALATLTIGIYVYSAFLLFARAHYALGDSRTPALVALASATAGVTVMAVGGALTSGATTVAFLGLGHTTAYAVGAVVLGVRLTRHTRQTIVPRALWRPAVVAAPIGLGVWLAARAIDPAGRVENLALVVVAAALAVGAYILGIRALGATPRLSVRPASGTATGEGPGDEPADVGAEP